MLKIIFAFFLILTSARPFSNPIYNTYFNFSTTGTKGPTDFLGNPTSLAGRGIAYYSTVNNLVGTASACNYRLEGSDDAVNWPGVIIPATSCVADGIVAVTAVATASTYIRVNLTAFTATSGGANVTINVLGFPVNN